MNQFKSIRSHFTFYIIILLCIFAIALTIISYASARNIRESFAIKYSNLYSRSTENRIINMITKNVSASLQMSQSPAILNWINNYTNLTSKNMALNTFNNFRKYLSSDTDIFIAIHSNLHYYFNNKYLHTLNPLKPSDKWYKEAAESSEKFILNIDYNVHLKTTKLWINVPIRENGKVIGIIGTGQDITLFLKKVLDTGEKGTSLVLTDKNGLIKAHKTVAYIDKLNIIKLLNDKNQIEILKANYSRLESNSDSMGSLYLNYENSRYYVAMIYLKPINWYLLFFVKIDEIVKLTQFLPLIITSVISIIVFFLIILFLTNRIIIKPLSVLTATTKQIADGNFNIRLEVTSGDELGNLTETFNHMTSTIKDYTDNLEDKVRKRTQELNEKNQLIMESINYAKTIQNSILPQEEELNKYLKSHFVYYKPRDIVGGDFYWFKELNDGAFYIAVADCTGHGVPGSLITMIAGSSLNMITEKIKSADPGKVLNELDRIIRNTLNQDKEYTGSNDGLEIGLCYFNPKNKELLFSGSKITLFYWDNGIKSIKGDKYKIGYKNKSNILPDFKNHKIPIIPGNTFYISTDGFYDQDGEDNVYPYGKTAFSALLDKIYKKSFSEQLEILDKNLKDYMKSKEQRDDITVLGFRV